MKILSFSKKINLFFISFFLFGTIFFSQTIIIHAQTQEKLKDSSLHVISDKMLAQKDTSSIEFIGNVKAIKDDSIVSADSIKIYFITDKDNDNKENIEKIVSTGNVRYTAGERKAFADKAVYTNQDGILVLTGKAAKLVTGSSFVTGKKITLFRQQNKVLVESDGQNRVEALFNPEDDISGKK